MALQAQLPPANTPEPYRYDEKSDFTGGLNLRADQFNLGETESPSLLNVSVDPRGGVRRRNGVTKVNATELSNEINRLMTHYESGQNQILATTIDTGAAQSQLYYNDDASGNFTGPVQIGSDNPFFNTVQPPTAVTFNGYTYISNGELMHNDSGVTTTAAIKWDGATATAMTPDIDASDGHFPCARYLAAWNEHVWVAYTEESATEYKNRVRFSKVSDAENWTATDYIDIDVGEDGDFITAIIPDQNRLLVFKQNSVYEILGFSRDNFQVRNVSRVAGNRDGCQPVAATMGVFFWYGEKGLYLIQNENLAYVFERLYPSLTYDVGQPALTLDNPPSLMWFNEKLWLSVDYQSDDNLSGSNQIDRRNTFVWDYSLGPLGAWVRYDINARSLLAYRPSGSTHFPIGVTSNITTISAFTRISKLDDETADVDTYASPANEIESFYQTSWFQGNRPTFKKRWGKPRNIVLSDNTAVIVMCVYKDYSLASSDVCYSKTFSGPGAAATWVNDDGSTGTGVWDTSEWAAIGTEDIYGFARWPTVGTAKAISLRFSVTPQTIDGVMQRGKWGMTSIVGMYRTRRLR
jgi:hypothetical protein